MSEGANRPGRIDLRQIAAATAIVIGMVATAAVAYLLLDILLLLFIGIVVAAALRPSHVVLCRWGIPRGPAVLHTIVVPAEDALATRGPAVQLPRAELREATGQVGQAVAQVETIIAATESSQGPVQSGHREASADNLDQATQRFREAV